MVDLRIENVEIRGVELHLRMTRGVEGIGLGLPLGLAPPELRGLDATARESLRGKIPAGWWPAVEMACLDALSRAVKAPLYQVLGGPTRHKVRVLTPLQGNDDEALRRALLAAQGGGASAFSVPLPVRPAARGMVDAVVSRLEMLRKTGGDTTDFVLRGDGILPAGEAGRVARAVGRFQLLWFDEPCALGNLAALRKIAEETVTPMGFGQSVTDAAQFQELLREQVVDVVRPRLDRFSLTDIRRIGALAESYYVAVAPAAVDTARGVSMAVHLAASMPNFFIQEMALGVTPTMTGGYVGLMS